MKTVLLYIRVSTEEQADKGYSLASQKEVLTKYASLKGWKSIKLFSDDYSAWKGFDRPGYLELKNYIQENKKDIDAVLFTQWSRFSRDYTEAAIEIRRLTRMGIQPNAIEQWIDFSVPENLFLLALYLTAPQVENDRLSQRTKAGNRQALKQGRWLWKAPYGYKNNTITKLIEVNPQQADIVNFCFQTLAMGLYSAESVRKIAIEKGLSLTKQAFINMLQNVIYIGKIRVPTFKDEAETLTHGQHQAIVDQETFNTVQSILRGKKKPYRGLTKDSELPLVGNLYCAKCNRQMTGSGSKGNGGIYHYYHCQRKYGCKNSFRAITANKQFFDYLKTFEPKQEVLELYYAVLEDVFQSNSVDREKEKKKIEHEIETIQDRIQKAIIKNLDGVWDDVTFKKTKSMLEDQKNEHLVRHLTLKNMTTEFSSYISFSKSLLSNLGEYYQNAGVEAKKQIIGSIFPDKIYFENNGYRTTRINEVVATIFNMSKGFKEKQLRKNSKLSSVAPPSGLEPETL